VVSIGASRLLSLKKRGVRGKFASWRGTVIEAEILARVALSLLYCICADSITMIELFLNYTKCSRIEFLALYICKVIVRLSM
jgi:hypothetical protein